MGDEQDSCEVRVLKVEDLLPPGIESLKETERANRETNTRLWELAANQPTSRAIFKDLKCKTFPPGPPRVQVFFVATGEYAIVSGVWSDVV
jgi:hypothetical protein